MCLPFYGRTLACGPCKRCMLICIMAENELAYSVWGEESFPARDGEIPCCFKRA